MFICDFLLPWLLLPLRVEICLLGTIAKLWGLPKAVMSRVGHGPFPSEFGGSRSETYCMQANPDGPHLWTQGGETYDIDALMKYRWFEMGKAMRVLSREYGTVSTPYAALEAWIWLPWNIPFA